MSEEHTKTYLGDGVYAWFDGFHIWLSTTPGGYSNDTIALEPAVWAALVKYAASLKESKS